MKKFKFFAIALLTAFLFAACGVDSKIDKLETACEDGDVEAVVDIMKDLEEEELTEEQEERIEQITKKHPDVCLVAALKMMADEKAETEE